MVEGIATEILCGICDEVCTRGSQVQCCGARSCRACAVSKITKDSKCWKCNKKIKLTVDLFDDGVLRKAVDSFKKDGKLKPKVEKLLQKTSDGANVADKKINPQNGPGPRPDVDNKRKERTWTTMTEKWEQPCFRGNKCKLKGKACLFNHDNDDEPKPKKAKANAPKPKKGATPIKKAATKTPTKVDQDKGICKFGTNCTRPQCKFAHPGKIDKPCNFGSSCKKADCKFLHENEGMRRNMAKMSSGVLGQMSKPMGMGGSFGSMGGSDMASYLQMQTMKANLEKMMGGYMGGRF